MTPPCQACGAGSVFTVLDLGHSPLADRFVKAGEPNPAYPLRMGVCRSCWTAQLLDHVPDTQLFGGDYGFLTGASPASAAYFKDFAEWALNNHLQRAKQGVVEIGCNDGTLLQWFRYYGCPAVGVDPATPAVTAAQDRGLHVHHAGFNREVGMELADEHGKAGLVVACNVIAHVRDPHDFLRGVQNLLADDGVAVIEFQLLDDLVADGQFDHVYHEHRFFFSVRSFARIAKRAGLSVLDWERTPAQGGSARVTLGRQPKPPPAVGEWLESVWAYTLMQTRADLVKDRLLTLLDGRTGLVAGYAASAKGTTLLNFCGISEVMLPYVVDLTPGKIGKVMPGTGIEIIHPANLGFTPDAYLLLARNYLGPVIRREHRYLARGGKIIVPIPTPVVI